MNAMTQPVVEALQSLNEEFDGTFVERVISTTAAQREVWLADKLGSQASLAFNEAVSLRLQGELDTVALQNALQSVLDRHAALRATVAPDGLEMLIGSPTATELTPQDLRSMAPQARQAVLTQAAKHEVITPFDLERGPLLRLNLFRVGDTQHELLMCAHHIVCDGWSWGVIVQDLAALYAEQIGVAPGPDAADDYADYVNWEAQANSGDAGQASERFWLGRFSGSALPVLDLPTDHKRAPVRGFASERIDHALSPSLVAAAKKTGARLGGSLFATLYCAFAATLQRLTGQSDVVIGVPSAGQSASQLHALVGHCVNLLPMRTEVDGSASFEALLRKTRGELLDAFDHQALTFGSLLSKLQVPRDPSRMPLVSVMFNVDPSLKPADLFPGLVASLRSIPRASENFELFANITGSDDGGLVVECQYNSALFDAATVARWLRCFEALLAGVCEAPALPMSQQSFLADGDLQQLRALQPTATAHGKQGLMHAAFAAQCLAQPQRAALRSGDVSLSYAELDARANRLARALRTRGAVRGARVGLCLPRGSEMLVALLAVLKSGASYVPLDPDFPSDRLAHCAEDAALALLLTDSRISSAPRTWRSDAAARVLNLDLDQSWLNESGDALPASAEDARPDDVAYVIYTSGSTGKPKGVALPHRAVANFLGSMQEQPGLHADDKLAAVTTLSFDIAVLELMLPLCVGGQVIIVPRETAIDGQALRELLASTGATAMQATPGMWRSLLDAGGLPRVPFKALVGGEALPIDLARDMLATGAEVWNMYGPTETTVWSTLWRVEGAALDQRGVSIGRPIANTTVWVVNDGGQLCPIGVPGEICIGGAGLALGYVDRPELTADRFITDPHSSQPGARLYRTGDRGRWCGDGLLEHLGRLDFQVKVRGYRIELGEIEAQCSEWPGVRSCVTVAREEGPGDVRLAAYLEMQEPGSLDTTALVQQLNKRLPAYMVPQYFVPLASLPRLPNGKIDRRSLPAPVAQASASRQLTAPRNDSERLVLSAMETVLKLPGVDLHDDFFAIGGHSLLAARLISQLNRELGLKLPMRTLFDAPTAAQLAAAVDALKPAQATVGAKPTVPTITARGAGVASPLTPMQERICFIEEMYPGRVTYSAPSAHLLAGPFHLQAFRDAWAGLLKRQTALRSYVAHDAETGRPQMLVAEQVNYALPFEDLSALPRDQALAQALSQIEKLVDTPIDIHQVPLFRATLYQIAPQEHLFFFMPHHLVWDGWSFDLLYDEMARSYGALAAGLPDSAPPPAVSFGDCAAWYVNWLSTPEHDRQLGYWRERYKSVQTPKPLGTDLDRRGAMTGGGATRLVSIDAELTERLRAFAQSANVTLSMLTMSVYVAMLTALMRSPTVILGVPVRGRALPEMEPVMGFFNNLLALPLAAAPQATVQQFAQGLRDNLLEALENQEVPFETVAATPEVAAHSIGGSGYQAMFSFQDARERQRQWGALQQTSISLFQKGATEDLGLWLLDTGAGLRGGITYNTELFKPATAEAVVALYLELLMRVVDHPQQKVAELTTWSPSSAGAQLAHLAVQSAPEPRASAAAAAAQAAQAAGPAKPLSELEHAVAEIWAEVLAIDLNQISRQDRFFALGGTSLLAMKCMVRLEERVGYRPPSSVFAENLPLHELAQVLRDRRRSDTVVRIRAGGDQAPLFLVHDGEGETLLYRNLAMRLPAGRPVLGLQPAATEHCALVHSTRSQMVDHYLQALRAVQPQGPYYLGGLCAGGTLAYELALRLRKENETVALLALLDANHPAAKQVTGLRTKQRMERLKSSLGQGQTQPLWSRLLGGLSTVGSKLWGAARYEVQSRLQARALHTKAQALRQCIAQGQVPPPALRGLSFAQLYASVIDDTDKSSRFEGDAVLLRATVGNHEQADHPFVQQYEDSAFGWREHVGGRLDVVDVSGGHVSMLREPHVQSAASQLQARMQVAAPPAV